MQLVDFVDTCTINMYGQDIRNLYNETYVFFLISFYIELSLKEDNEIYALLVMSKALSNLKYKKVKILNLKF